MIVSKPWRLDHEMQMGRSTQRISRPPQEPSDRSVVRHPITCGFDRAIVKAAIFIRPKVAAQVVFRLQIRLLVFVEALSVSLPGDDFGAGDWMTVEILHPTRYVEPFSPMPSSEIVLPSGNSGTSARKKGLAPCSA